MSNLEQIRIASETEQQEWLATLELKEPNEANILILLLWLQLNPNTIKAHVFPLLSLPDDLKRAIWQDGVEASKARELSKLTVEATRLAITQAGNRR